MAITGIASFIYGVDDISESTRFFEDFGLVKSGGDETYTKFLLEEGSTVIVKHISDPSLPETVLRGTGVREAIWGVDSEENLEALVRGLEIDREVTRDADGTVHFHTDCGLAMGLRVFTRNKVVTSPDPINSPGHVARFNIHRKWKTRARPKAISHVVFAVEDYVKSYRFMEERLGFRLSEYQLTLGIYLRCDGTHDHHNLFFLDYTQAGAPGYPVFHHANYVVEDIDELMVGSNYMIRKGWTYGALGTGRHRISSALFSYFQSPAGGETEYGADADYVDDSYIPREWNALFGIQIWMGNPPEWVQHASEVEWHGGYLRDGIPAQIRSKADLPEGGRL